MLRAAFLALNDLTTPEFRRVLLKALALTLGLFVALLVGTEFLIGKLANLPWAWAETIVQLGTGLALLVAFFFLMAPVAAIFAGIFLDEIAAVVEARHYPRDPPGTPLTPGKALLTGLQFGLVVLLVNLAILPLVFFAVGAVVLVFANAYLISREYFEMAAMRHMPVAEARQLRRENAPQILVAGLLPALAALVPLLNLFVPLFATSYFAHIFKRVAASSG